MKTGTPKTIIPAGHLPTTMVRLSQATLPRSL